MDTDPGHLTLFDFLSRRSRSGRSLVAPLGYTTYGRATASAQRISPLALQTPSRAPLPDGGIRAAG